MNLPKSVGTLRAALIYKLKQSAVGGSFLQVIKSMYENAKCRVKVGGVLSREIESLFGVLQGGMISPKLFTEYLHDLYLQPKFGIVLDENIEQYNYSLC